MKLNIIIPLSTSFKEFYYVYTSITKENQISRRQF